MSDIERIVIIGASLGGGSAAIALREQGYTGSLVVIGEETHRPYERPPLSKALLVGEVDEPDWVGEDGFFTGDGVTYVSGVAATSIDTAAQTVTAGGESYAYDRLLLATGSAARRLDVPGADLPGVFTLRTLDDALALRARFTAGAKVVVVGAGWIGCEVAAAARAHDCEVVLIGDTSQPLDRVLGPQVGGFFARVHTDHGVDLRLNTSVSAFTGDKAVTAVEMGSAESVEADTVVVGVGATLNIALAVAAGLEIADGGVAVDASLRTSDPHVYAVGDIAAHDHPAYPGRIRVEHWDTAKNQGTHVAQNLLGADQPYTTQPFFFSDQYDVGCEYRGHADPAHDELVVSGSLGSGEFTAFWLHDGAVAAAMNVNQWDDGDALQALVDARATMDREDLAAGKFDLPAA